MIFPYEKPRPFQNILIKKVKEALVKRIPILLHAPTGSGKTAGVLCPSLEFASQKGLKLLFCTARQTQHEIVLKTVNELNEKCNTDFKACSLIAKRQFCAQEGALELPQQDFLEWCRHLRERRECNFYENAIKFLKAAEERLKKEVLSAEKLKLISSELGFCPYEVALNEASKADVTIADYSYAFKQLVSESFFKKSGWSFENTILILDEAHNLPNRIQEMYSSRLTTRAIGSAIGEAKKFGLEEVLEILFELQEALLSWAKNEETLVERNALMDLIDSKNAIEKLSFGAEAVRESQRRSFIGGVESFMKSWQESKEGFARILKKKENWLELSIRCLDPSVVSKAVIKRSYCTIAMSGTLTPLEMYSDVLGFEKPISLSLPSPFPSQNRLALIVPKTTTLYKKRNKEQYRSIAELCSYFIDQIPGSLAVYFPSYELMGKVLAELDEVEKELLIEKQGMSKEEKAKLISKLKEKNLKGRLLLAVASGSFSEGIDLPGVLNAVIVVGLPLERPDLETKERIAYYEKKFHGKGWDYGYTLPALSKCVQAAGRAIRTEHDRAALLFVDERFSQPRYRRVFPEEWEVRIMEASVVKEVLKEFFQGSSS